MLGSTRQYFGLVPGANFKVKSPKKHKNEKNMVQTHEKTLTHKYESCDKKAKHYLV